MNKLKKIGKEEEIKKEIYQIIPYREISNLLYDEFIVIFGGFNIDVSEYGHLDEDDYKYHEGQCNTYGYDTYYIVVRNDEETISKIEMQTKLPINKWIENLESLIVQLGNYKEEFCGEEKH